jgi:hypothetical protein
MSHIVVLKRPSVSFLAKTLQARMRCYTQHAKEKTASQEYFAQCSCPLEIRKKEFSQTNKT